MSLSPQIVAADPRLTVFVTANAGSGKTTTLVNRVARLLLDQVDPGAILCVTYTKAAAAEMQRRLFDLLGQWSVCDDTALRAALASRIGQEQADAMRILYGGSMNGDNAAEIIALPDVDGGLVGGASLSAAKFEPVIAAAD